MEKANSQWWLRNKHYVITCSAFLFPPKEKLFSVLLCVLRASVFVFLLVLLILPVFNKL